MVIEPNSFVYTYTSSLLTLSPYNRSDQEFSVPTSWPELSVTLSVQVPTPVSPQSWVLDVVKTMLSCAHRPAPGRLISVLTVPLGEVRVTIRSPMYVWLMLRSTSTWSMLTAEPMVMLLAVPTLLLSGIAALGEAVPLTTTSLAAVAWPCQVSASLTAARASTRPAPASLLKCMPPPFQ